MLAKIAMLLADIRLAFVQVIATTAIGAIVTNGGGLGRYIVDGFATGRGGRAEVLAGALLLGALTLAAEGSFALAERRLIPAGVRREDSLARAAEQAVAAGWPFREHICTRKTRRSCPHQPCRRQSPPPRGA